MADQQESGRAPRSGPMAYGMAPVVTGGVLSVGLLGALLFGGGTMLQQMAEGPPKRPAATSTATPGSEEPGSTSTPGATPGTQEPGTASPTEPGTASPTGTPTGSPTGEPTASPSGEPSDPATEPDPGTGGTDPNVPGESGSDPANPTPHQTPGHPGDPGDWEYSANGDVVHQVVRGDTLSKISAQYGVSVERIAEYNSIRDVNLIYADSALEIPWLRIPPAEK